MALNDFKDINQGGGVLTVSNSNIGKGIKWNPNTKQYEVNIGEGLEVNEQGQVVAKKIVPVTTFNNGSGAIVSNVIIIDYGNGLIEFSGRVVVSCTSLGNYIVTKSPYGIWEGMAGVDLTSLNLKQLVSVSLTAGNQETSGVDGNAWLIAEPKPEPILKMMRIGAQMIDVPGIHDLGVFFTVKGIKA